MPTTLTFNNYRNAVAAYGKENLGELLYALAENTKQLSAGEQVRIYLEDLTRGTLTCVHATGPLSRELVETTFPIVSEEAVVSRVFANQIPIIYKQSDQLKSSTDYAFAARFSFRSSHVMPIVSQGKSIGALCIDQINPGETVSSRTKIQLAELIAIVADHLDQARIYHQQVRLARRLEKFKAREAAGMMVRSAVRLIEKVSLAAVLAPTHQEGAAGALENLASYSADENLKKEYDRLGALDLRKGMSLISNYINDQGLITDERLLKPLFIPDLTQHNLQKRALTESLELRSLYVVPRFDPETRRIICLLNYYSHDLYQFSDFEMGLLQTHAEMVEKVISEVGGEHLEIRVLSEISDLLNERTETLQPFLTRVLSKATELIGADTGSIAVVTEREGAKWLVVEDENGAIIGAKNKEWLKKYIPPLQVGGSELPREERSLTGYVAFTKQPRITSRVEAEQQRDGFHRSMSDLLKSEIAVPIICDDEVIAVVCLNSLQYDYFREEHRRILQIIGSLTARHISDLQRIERLQGEVNRLTTDVAYKDPHISSYRLGNIIGNSRKSREMVDFINTVSPPLFNRILFWSRNILQEATIGLPSILVTGQTGSGKEFFFNNLYNKLNELYRRDINPSGELPVKKTNIAAYSGDLTYSELFGHKKGAFTGAYSDRRGILEETIGGIVFLDEIGDADPKTQVQLLRFLDNGGFMRLGENTERYSRVLLVAATNKNLADEITAGRFREDLYHRLSELSIRLPSLNERREDIPDLSVHFLGKLYRTYRSANDAEESPPSLAEEAKQILMRHSYKGNIRELRSILLRALFFRRTSVITGEAISEAIAGTGRLESRSASSVTHDLDQRLADEIIEAIAAGGDFWSDVYEPFSRNDISRETVRLVIERTRSSAGKTMPAVARHLKAFAEGLEKDEEQRQLFRFKNFLYKTVKIG
ncbi:MAG: GPMC system transcriptional regulator [Desulfuromonadaceae bacterium]|nr:GPMC system transcriptional regulator [Desulfuromonadaceae bacterium]MDD2847149.1 GPMC system transcriptional regulator [Desulfuromonadaceae bacterium]MDD4130093.1 GPMC system transcriptional regulator [Desulfuromonadaceae bacterium]